MCVRALTHASDPCLAAACVDALALALRDDPSSDYFCRPGRAEPFYRSVLTEVATSFPGDPAHLFCITGSGAAGQIESAPSNGDAGKAGVSEEQAVLAAAICYSYPRLQPPTAAVADMAASASGRRQSVDWWAGLKVR